MASEKNAAEEDRKIMRNYLDEETLDEEYKKAMNQYFGKKDKKGESPDMSQAKRARNTSQISSSSSISGIPQNTVIGWASVTGIGGN